MVNGPDLDNLQNKVHANSSQGPGERLRAAREALGYPIEDVAKQLRLHPVTIDDLEHNTFEEGLALVFVRGYLRAYSAIVGINADQVIDEFNALHAEEPREMPDLATKAKEIQAAKRQNRPSARLQSHPGYFWGSLAVMVLAISGLITGYFYQPAIKPAPIAEVEPIVEINTAFEEEIIAPLQEAVVKQVQTTTQETEVELPKPELESERISKAPVHSSESMLF